MEYNIEFTVDKENNFFNGADNYFEILIKIDRILGEALDVNLVTSHKMVELETEKVSFNVRTSIDYPGQSLLGGNFSREQINAWIEKGREIILKTSDVTRAVHLLDSLACDLKFEDNFLYVPVSSDELSEILDVLKNLSIILFKRVDFSY